MNTFPSFIGAMILDCTGVTDLMTSDIVIYLNDIKILFYRARSCQIFLIFNSNEINIDIESKIRELKIPMNPKQENIAKKIPRKINKNNKNNKQGALPRCSDSVGGSAPRSNTAHGLYDDEIRGKLKKIGIPDNYEHYQKMFDSLNGLYYGKIVKFNNFISSDPKIYNYIHKDCYIGKFFKYCYDKIKKQNPNYEYISSEHRIKKIKNEAKIK